MIRECHKLIARSYPGTRGVALVLTLAQETPPGRDRELSLIWLAELETFVLRLVGPGAGHLERIPMRTASRSADAAGEIAGAARPTPPPFLPYVTPLSGRPNPISETENRLEKHLAQCSWALGRRWNHTISPGPVEPPLRVDLVWEAERCIVEIDGPEHASLAKYEADRRRDRVLQHGGFAVLRFTNAEVNGDLARTAGEIGAYVERVRRGNDNGNKPRPI